MIHFERSFDYPLIRAILTVPAIWRHISDDGSPAPADYQPIESELLWYVLVWDEKELLGLWMFHPHNTVCWEVHTALLPNAWGERARQAARQMTDWIWAHTPCCRIITNVPETERIALKFALAAGMEEYGRNPRSFLKDGRLLDQILLGISKPTEMPRAEVSSPVAALARAEEGDESCQPL